MPITTSRSSANQLPPVVRPSAAPAKPTPAIVPFERDTLMDKAPTAAELDQARGLIAKVKAIREVPFTTKAKGPWLVEAKSLLAKAQQAEKLLGDAAFWHKSVSESEVAAVRTTTIDFAAKIHSVEKRAGVVPTEAPLNPFRPLFQFTDRLEPNLKPSVLGGIVLLLTLPVAAMIDIADAVTRPVQVVLWPVAWTWHGLKAVGRKLGVG